MKFVICQKHKTNSKAKLIKNTDFRQYKKLQCHKINFFNKRTIFIYDKTLF